MDVICLQDVVILSSPFLVLNAPKVCVAGQVSVKQNAIFKTRLGTQLSVILLNEAVQILDLLQSVHSHTTCVLKGHLLCLISTQ